MCVLYKTIIHLFFIYIAAILLSICNVTMGVVVVGKGERGCFLHSSTFLKKQQLFFDKNLMSDDDDER